MKVYPKNLKEVMEWDLLSYKLDMNLSIILPFKVGMFSHETGKMVYPTQESSQGRNEEAETGKGCNNVG